MNYHSELPKPYYHDEDAGITIYNCDCRDILPLLPKVDLVLTDPPYGMDYNTDNSRFTMGGRNDRSIIGDDSPFDPSPFLSFPHVILWGANHYANKLPTGTTLVWLKRHPHNYGYFLSDAEIGWKSDGYGVYVYYAPDSAGRRQKEYTGDPFGGETAHPFQKPLALMSWCIEQTKTDGLILDPFMGSGTTLVAALQLGRKAIGIEIELKYCEIAVKRLQQGVLNFSTQSGSKAALSHEKPSPSSDDRMDKGQLDLLDSEHRRGVENI